MLPVGVPGTETPGDGLIVGNRLLGLVPDPAPPDPPEPLSGSRPFSGWVPPRPVPSPDPVPVD